MLLRDLSKNAPHNLKRPPPNRHAPPCPGTLPLLRTLLLHVWRPDRLVRSGRLQKAPDEMKLHGDGLIPGSEPWSGAGGAPTGHQLDGTRANSRGATALVFGGSPPSESGVTHHHSPAGDPRNSNTLSLRNGGPISFYTT